MNGNLVKDMSRVFLCLRGERQLIFREERTTKQYDIFRHGGVSESPYYVKTLQTCKCTVEVKMTFGLTVGAADPAL